MIKSLWQARLAGVLFGGPLLPLDLPVSPPNASSFVDSALTSSDLAYPELANSTPATLASPSAATPSAPAKPNTPAAAESGKTPPPKQASLLDWLPGVDFHGGVAVYLYQPTNGLDPLYNIYSTLKIKATWDWFGLYFEPRLTTEKMRPYYESLAWVQQAYAFAQLGTLTLKVGKVYKQIGLFWDNSFYGNIQVYEGLKFDPNSGVSLEGSWGKNLGIDVSAQYFVVDGYLNSSLDGRDTVSIPGARRRNIIAGRVQPYYQPLPHLRLTFGLSGESFVADLPDERNQVQRVAADIRLQAKALGLWGEVLHQFGASVNAFPDPGDPSASPPLPGRASASNTYLLAGVEYDLKWFVPRYNLSIADYWDLDVREVLHLWGVTYPFHAHGSLYVEYAWWDRFTPEGRISYDRSINLTVMGYF